MPKIEAWLPYLLTGLRVLAILIGAWIATHIARRMLGQFRQYVIRTMLKRGDGSQVELEKRATTIIQVLSRVSGSAVWSLALVMALHQMGFDVRALIAGAGLFGLALGLGAQNLIKDVIGGLFLLIENQIRINDAVVINGTGGVVEEMNLRTTVLRDENGAVHIFPNGSIQTLSNLTRDYSYYVLEITVAHHQDTDRALAALRREAEQIMEEQPYASVILAPLDVMGVDRLTDRGWVLKARLKTLPSQQYLVGRELNRRIKRAFEAEGIEFPQPPLR